MAAITGLQLAQYGREFRTNDSVPVDYVQLAGAVTGVRALHGGFDARRIARGAESRRTRMTGSRSCMCRSMPDRTNSRVWAPGDNGTSATGATTFSANGSSRIFDSLCHLVMAGASTPKPIDASIAQDGLPGPARFAGDPARSDQSLTRACRPARDRPAPSRHWRAGSPRPRRNRCRGSRPISFPAPGNRVRRSPGSARARRSRARSSRRT